jgi:PIN domain nuclease of toxin-antitoxin system
MRLMLDTHVLLWWLQDNARLGLRARSLIADTGSEVLVSIATPWEIAVKQRVGKVDDSGAAVMNALLEDGMAIVDLRPAHLQVLEAMPLLHRDPFDHLIIAQALAEQAIVITDDAKFPDYGVRCIPA